MRTTLKQFVPAAETPPAQEILEAHAARLWHGMPFAWKDELELWKLHSAKVGQVLTIEGLEMWLERVQAAECPIAGPGCAPPVPISRFCKFHYDQLGGR
jgi:hypothetical protein